jgi:hypothetical protein
MKKTITATIFLLLACVTVFGQTTYKGLTPGKSTKADVQRVLGPAVNAANPLLVEYRPQPLTGKIYVQYRKGAPVVERIEFLCRLANSTCNDLLNRLMLRLPENQETAKIIEGGGKNKQVLYYGTPLYLVVSVDDEGLVNNEVMPYRVAFFSRELYAASAAEVKEANEAAVLKGSGSHGGGSSLSGSWRIIQTGANGARNTGVLKIRLSGNTLSGRAEWDNHAPGNISGEVEGRTIKFTIQYGGGLIGSYEAELSSQGNQMQNGEARSNKGGAVVSWQANRLP